MLQFTERQNQRKHDIVEATFPLLSLEMYNKTWSIAEHDRFFTYSVTGLLLSERSVASRFL